MLYVRVKANTHKTVRGAGVGDRESDSEGQETLTFTYCFCVCVSVHAEFQLKTAKTCKENVAAFCSYKNTFILTVISKLIQLIL